MLQEPNLAVQGGHQKALAIVRHGDAADGLQQLVRDQLTLANVIAAQATIHAATDDLLLVIFRSYLYTVQIYYISCV